MDSAQPHLQHQHRSSIQNISLRVIAKPLSSARSKSLPNISILPSKSQSEIIARSICGHNYHHSSAACVSSASSTPKKHQRPKILKKTWDKVKTIIHPSSSSSSRRGSLRKSENSSFRRVCSSAPSTPVQKLVFDFEGLHQSSIPGDQNQEIRETSPEDSEKIQRNYAQLQKRLSEELHQRMSEYKPESRNLADNLSQDFKKRLQQWEMWKVSTGKVTYTEEELQLILPEEFSKKLHEWECMKTGIGSHHPTCESAASIMTTTSSTGTNTSSEAKNKSSRKKKNSDTARQKELAWLEKQLDKIETEKKRLERELKKYSEREARLEKMKEALKNSPNDVWIRTPTANCKVEKITEKFTKKLYEWEERQGIQPESSTMALLCPQYYGPPPEQDISMEEADVSETLRINEQPESPAGACGQTSSVSSSDYEEATDSFATHDKGNSGASNTDSDFYRAEPGGSSRRRSSDAISTPLSARSPSLSAFTSDDEGDPGLLKTVTEKEEQEESDNNLLKDAGSQTEVILRAKPIVVEDNEEIDCDNAGVFVPTKRTIFTPIVDEREAENIVVEPELKSPLLVRSLLQQQENKTQQQQQQQNEVWKKIEEGTGSKTTTQNAPIVNKPSPAPMPPKIVGAIPKMSNPPQGNITSAPRPFPKMGKIPVWCSPLGARRQFLNKNVTTANTPPSSDFSLDKFLQETNILSGDVSCSSSSAGLLSSRIPVASPGVARKYTIGGGILPSGNYRSKLLTRSNSFGIRLDNEMPLGLSGSRQGGMEAEGGGDEFMEEELSHNVACVLTTSDSDSSCYNVAVTKSKSTGSIKSFSRAFAHRLGFGLTSTKNCSGGAAGNGAPAATHKGASCSNYSSASSANFSPPQPPTSNSASSSSSITKPFSGWLPNKK